MIACANYFLVTLRHHHPNPPHSPGINGNDRFDVKTTENWQRNRKNALNKLEGLFGHIVQSYCCVYMARIVAKNQRNVHVFFLMHTRNTVKKKTNNKNPPWAEIESESESKGQKETIK